MTLVSIIISVFFPMALEWYAWFIATTLLGGPGWESSWAKITQWASCYSWRILSPGRPDLAPSLLFFRKRTKTELHRLLLASYTVLVLPLSYFYSCCCFSFWQYGALLLHGFIGFFFYILILFLNLLHVLGSKGPFPWKVGSKSNNNNSWLSEEVSQILQPPWF